jgi:hypothetical protein
MLPVDHRSTAARRYRLSADLQARRPAPAGGILLRVDPASGRVAGWLRDPRWVFQDVLADGLRGAWVATTAPELLHVVAA